MCEALERIYLEVNGERLARERKEELDKAVAEAVKVAVAEAVAEAVAKTRAEQAAYIKDWKKNWQCKMHKRLRSVKRHSFFTL